MRSQATGTLHVLDSVSVSLHPHVLVCARWEEAMFVYPLSTRGIQASAMWSSMRNCMNKHE